MGKQNAQDRSKAIKEYCKWCTNGKIAACGTAVSSLWLCERGGRTKATQNTLPLAAKRHIGTDLTRKKEGPYKYPYPSQPHRQGGIDKGNRVRAPIT